MSHELSSAAALGSRISDFIRRHLAGPAGERAPAVFGLCGPQGIGKTTISAQMSGTLAAQGYRTLIVGLDNLYLSRARRLELARDIHPLFATRGVPGTHETALGVELIDRARSGKSFAVPQFDKATDDRAPAADWPVWKGHVDVVVLEGWCVGAKPQTEEELRKPFNALEAIEDPDATWRAHSNRELAGPYQRLFAELDALILLCAPNFEIVAAWRKEQEAGLRQRHASDAAPIRAMTDREIDRFVQFYERLSQHILKEMPPRAAFVARLDGMRRVTDIVEDCALGATSETDRERPSHD